MYPWAIGGNNVVYTNYLYYSKNNAVDDCMSLPASLILIVCICSEVPNIQLLTTSTFCYKKYL
jgi:hypothetical protein